MMIEVSFDNGSGFHRIELVQKSDGVYVFVYERVDSQFPERDYLDDTWESARARCAEDFSVPLQSWKTLD
jgi:hypothetical protein